MNEIIFGILFSPISLIFDFNIDKGALSNKNPFLSYNSTFTNDFFLTSANWGINEILHFETSTFDLKINNCLKISYQIKNPLFYKF
jgi:hypothetical protein